MACTLKQSLKPGVDFEGISRCDFEITIDPTQQSTLHMVSATYGDLTKTGAKAKFKVLAGESLLSIVYAATQNGEAGYLTEICGGVLVHLRKIRSTNDFNREYILEGIQS